MASGPGIYLATGLTVLLSLLLGSALCADGRRWSWLAPGCGFAAVLAIAWIGVRLPGDGVTGAVLLLIAAGASAVRLRGGLEWRPLLIGIPAALLVLVATALPFLANHRFGALGATVNDDLALHLEFADILSLGGNTHGSVDIAYPVGPHSIVAALHDVLGLSIESAFVGVIIAVPVITALTALAALQHVPRALQPIGAALAGLSYLSAAFLAQASFKETVIASIVLTFTLVLREAVRDRTRWRRWLVPLLALVFAGLGAFSVPALFWFVGIGATVTVVTMFTERIRPGARLALGVVAIVVALVGTIVVFEALTSFFRLGPGRFVLSASEGGADGKVQAGGNLFGPLSFFEALGIWPSTDFRLDPVRDGWKLHVALATLATAVGFAITAARRECVLLGTTIFAVLTYLLVAELSIAYNAAKALVIATPLIALVTMAGLLAPIRRTVPALLVAVLAAVFVVGAAQSSVLPLKNGIVRPENQAEAFRQLRDAVAGQPTLFLGRENYAAWELRSTRIGYLGRGARADSYGNDPPVGAASNRDVDSLQTWELNAVAWLIAPNTLFASLPGPEFREVLSNRWYKLYKRAGPSPVRQVLSEDGTPGATLRCSTRLGKLAVRAGGRAFVRPRPVIGPVGAWTSLEGGRPPPDMPVALAGNSQELGQVIRLPKGRWEISLSWASSIPVEAKVGRRKIELPPYIGDGDRHWRVASVRGGRRLEIRVRPGPERRFDVPRGAQIGRVAAVREDVKGRFVPVRRACGRYVDFIER